MDALVDEKWIRWTGRRIEAPPLTQRAVEYAIKLIENQDQENGMQTRERVMWTASLMDCYKVNFDGVKFQWSSSVGIRVQVRDHSCFEWENTSGDDCEEGKKLSVVMATNFTREIGLQNMIVEGDLSFMISTLSSTIPNFPVSITCSRMQKSEPNFSQGGVKCTSKDCNKAANTSALG